MRQQRFLAFSAEILQLVNSVVSSAHGAGQ
jgi:hypothetical protein